MADEKSLMLGIKDRLTISVLFPTTGSYISQILVEDISKKVRINQEEMVNIGFKLTRSDVEGNSNYVWNGEKAKDKEIVFSQTEIDFLKKQIDRLDKAEQITPDILPLIKGIKAL